MKLVGPGASQSYSLNLVLSEPVLCAIIELRRARAFVSRHLLSVFQRATIAEIGRDAGCAERVAANRRGDAGCDGSAPDHAPSIGLGHGLL